MLFSLFAMADNWNATMYHQIEQSVKEPSFPDRTFNITSYGATPKASAAKNQKAINTAISICAKKGGGRVIVPAGTFNTGAITLKSNVNLEIQ